MCSTDAARVDRPDEFYSAIDTTRPPRTRIALPEAIEQGTAICSTWECSSEPKYSKRGAMGAGRSVPWAQPLASGQALSQLIWTGAHRNFIRALPIWILLKTFRVV